MRLLHGNDDHGPAPTPTTGERFTLRRLDTGESYPVELTPVEDAPPNHDRPADPDAGGHPHPDDEGKHNEHVAMLNLVKTSEVTNWTVKSGAWSDASTWSKGVPVDGDFCWNTPGKSLKVDVETAAIDRLRCDGELDIKDNSHLRVVTLIGTPTGHLKAVGTRNARITFLERGERDIEYDPMDLSGGLIWHGSRDIRAYSPEPYARPSVVPQAGDSVIVFDSLPRDWQVGDTLFVTGTDPAGFAVDLSEYRQIEAIEGNTIHLNVPCEFSHGGINRHPEAFLVGNVSRRGLTLTGSNTADLSQRPHVMFMHKQDGLIEGLAVIECGRTDAKRQHTNSPTGDNQMGRYPLHLHIVNGATRESVPAEIRNCVVIGGPKHGIASHGSHAIIEYNIVTGCIGSGIFHENGTELGVTRYNLINGAVSDVGAIDGNRLAVKPRDFGGDGFGIWLQSQNVDIIGNTIMNCFHGTGAFCVPLEGGEPDRILVSNLRPEHREAVAMGREKVQFQEVPGVYIDNDIIGCRKGYMVWIVNLDIAEHDVKTVIKGGRVLAFERLIKTIYARQVRLENITATAVINRRGGKPHVSTYVVEMNTETADQEWINVVIDGVQHGIDLPHTGHNAVKNCDINAVSHCLFANGCNGSLEITGNTYGPLLRKTSKPIKVNSFGNKISKFTPSLVQPYEMTVDGDRIYPDAMRPDAKPYEGRKNVVASQRDLTNAELVAMGGSPAGGYLAPELSEHPLVMGGGVGPVVPVPPATHNGHGREAKFEGYPNLFERVGDIYVGTIAGVEYRSEPVTLEKGMWQQVIVRSESGDSLGIMVGGN